MKALLRLLYSSAYPLLVAYWFVFRPNTYGAKVVIERDGEVLLVKHSYGSSHVWSFPGGGKKAHETFEETAIRETKEETGLTLRSVTFIGNFVTNGEYKHDHVHVFLGEAPEGDIKIDSEEIIAYEWATHGSERRWTHLGEKIWSMYLHHRNGGAISKDI